MTKYREILRLKGLGFIAEQGSAIEQLRADFEAFKKSK